MSDKPQNLRGHGLVYMHVFPDLREAARNCGYALAVHGSMQKDLDLIAVPWTKEAVGPDDLVKAFMGGTDVEFGGGFYRSSQRREEPNRKDHGRLCYTLIVEDTPGAFIDLSVMPRITTAEVVK